jgi:hypothetical protein
MFEFGSQMAAVSCFLCFFMMSMYLLVVLFPHQEELLPDYHNHAGDPEGSGHVGVVDTKQKNVISSI